MSDLLGVDVHGDRGDQNWHRWGNAGVSFVAVKATEGATFTDKRFTAARVRAINDASLVFIGAYHFGYPENGSDWKEEADHYLAVCKKAGVDWSKTWPIMDIERNGPPPEGPWVRAWCEYVAKKTGRDKYKIPGLVYAGYYFWKDAAGMAPPPRGWERWLPWYGRSTWPPSDPWNRVLIWQDSEHWAVQGIPGGWDRNRFRGTRSDLRKLISEKRK